MTNIYEINDLVDFLETHEITVKQFIYCLLLSHDKKHNRIEGSHKISKPLSKIYKYHHNIDPFLKTELQELEKKGFIKKDGDKYHPDMMEVTDKFEKNWYGDKYKIEQLIEAYPDDIENFNHPSKPRIPLLTFDDYEKIKNRYNQLVKTYKMHNRVLALVQWGKENKKIKMGIEKFINSKGWEHLQKIKNHSLEDNTMSV